MSDRCGKAYFPYSVLLAIPLFVWLNYWRNSAHISIVPSSGNSLLLEKSSPVLQFVHHENARCLDGSPPAYYIRKGFGEGRDKWIVFFEGGGWCYDLEQCHLRSKTILGSSKNYFPELPNEELKFYLSNNEDINPLMYNWNTVLVKYCDGGSYAGDAIQTYKGQNIYFKGRINRDETIRSLFRSAPRSHTKPAHAHDNVSFRSHNMSTATEVVIGGCSAGGLGIFMGLDQMASIVLDAAKDAGNHHVQVRGLSDSGFFMEHTSSYRAKITHNAYGKDDAVTANSVRHNGGQYFMDYASCMRDLFNFMNLSAGVNQACVHAQQRLVSQGTVSNASSFGIESNCVFAAHLVPHIKTPLFLLQPQYDYWQILHIFSQAYTSPEVNTYGQGVVKKLKMSLFHGQHPGHGVFIDSCAHHCTSCSDETENTWSGNHVRSTVSVNASVLVGADGASRQRVDVATAAGSATTSSRDRDSRLRRRLSPAAHVVALSSAAAERFHWNEAESFAVWYQHSLLRPQGGAPITPGINWFFQDRPYPCGDCCSCSTDMIGRLRKVYPL